LAGSFSGGAKEEEAAESGAAAALATAAPEGDRGSAGEGEGEGEGVEEVYFAKFLTSSKLMTLQLRDGYFRRHVLVQVHPVKARVVRACGAGVCGEGVW